MAVTTATDLVVLLSGLKDRGIPLASVKVMVDIGDGAEVNGLPEFEQDSKTIVIRPRPAGV
jgi:hypothetical protein